MVSIHGSKPAAVVPNRARRSPPCTTDPKERRGYVVWAIVGAAIAIPELWAAASKAQWPTISATVGHLEVLWSPVKIIVVALIAAAAIQLLRYPPHRNEYAALPGRPPRWRTANGRLTRATNGQAELVPFCRGLPSSNSDRSGSIRRHHCRAWRRQIRGRLRYLRRPGSGTIDHPERPGISLGEGRAISDVAPHAGQPGRAAPLGRDGRPRRPCGPGRPPGCLPVALILNSLLTRRTEWPPRYARWCRLGCPGHQRVACRWRRGSKGVRCARSAS